MDDEKDLRNFAANWWTEQLKNNNNEQNSTYFIKQEQLDIFYKSLSNKIKETLKTLPSFKLKTGFIDIDEILSQALCSAKISNESLLPRNITMIISRKSIELAIGFRGKPEKIYDINQPTEEQPGNN